MFLSDLAIDVSGVPGENCYFGLVSFNAHKKVEIIKEFYKKFPELRGSRWKGTKLGDKKLLDIVKYLDGEKVHFCATKFLSSDWQHWKSEIGGALFNERIYAIMTYKLLNGSCWRSTASKPQSFGVALDEKSNLDMDSMIDTCRRLCKGNKLIINFNKSKAKHNDLIKFADYCAAAYRKVNIGELKKLDHFKLPNNKLNYRELNKAFRLYKNEKVRRRIEKL